MKIVKIKGGLGNQLFQYSFARLLQQKTGDTVKLDMSAYNDTLDDPIRQPRLLKFNIPLEVAIDKEIRNKCLLKHKGHLLTTQYRLGIAAEALFNPKYYFEKDRRYRAIEKIKKFDYFDGYWQSWKHVDEVWNVLKKDLVPRNNLNFATINMIEKVSAQQSVFIGVRRGDYQEHSDHWGTFTQEYYSKAVNYICERIENPVFYVFSNDISWVKKNLVFDGKNVIYREPYDVIDDFDDLLIMANCKHSIIINSTFHWWGAQFNYYHGKIVVAPKKWFFDGKLIDIIPPKWKMI